MTWLQLITLVKMINHHSNGVLVEGLDTEHKRLLVQRYVTLAAQGYSLSPPTRIGMLHHLSKPLPVPPIE